MKKYSIIVLSLLASSAIHAGPQFDQAITRGKLLEGRPETEAHYIERMKMLGIWLLSRMEYLRAEESSKKICQERLKYLQQLIEDATKSQYSWAAAAIDEINKEIPASVGAYPEQFMKEKKEEFEILADYYSGLHAKMSGLDNASARSWLAIAPQPGAVRF